MISEEVVAVIRRFAANEHVIVLDDLFEREQVIVVHIGRSEQMVHFFVCYFAIRNIIIFASN